MAYYGRINGSTSNGSISCYISYTCIPSTIYNNTEVRATLYYSRTDGYVTYGTWSGSLTINGNTKSGSSSIQLNGSNTVSVISHTVTVPHNADGTKSITISATGGASGTTLTSTSCSKRITLEPIPRQANLTAANDFNDEGNPTITYNNLAGNAVSSLQACIADANGNVIHVAYRDIDKTGTTYTFNLTAAERTALLKAYTTSNSNTVKFYVKTVIGEETFYSSLAKTFSIVNGSPTLNPTAIDVDSAMTALTGNNNNIVKYYSDIQYAANAAARKQATIKSYKITCGSASSTTATGTFTNVSTATVVFSVTDSRGNTTTQTLNKTLIPYIKLTNDMAVNAPTTDGKLSLTASGNYFSGSFGANSNTLTVQYRYKTNSGEYGNWITISATVDAANNKYTATTNLTGLDYKSSYTFQTRAIDKIATIAAAEKKVKTTPVFDWGSNDFEFNVPVLFNAGYSNYNVLLWQGAWYMTANQTASLASSVQNQPNGIVLVFSNYDSSTSTANNYDWHCFFVPKYLVDIQGNTGHTFNMMSQSFGDICSKYLYISNTSIRGNDNNTKAATNNGINYNNSKYVMRYVFGV